MIAAAALLEKAEEYRLQAKFAEQRGELRAAERFATLEVAFRELAILAELEAQEAA